ncbi:Slow green 1 protein [Thalictrum thalictroides]|uniref:Slow green 1 protein n=1 Tax=Thalictrum thalictroides TaxID=46969 RepID=A0A7J6X9T4_THATH|nr:Slow green 1 protein [Thalictrum thalictroides]
MEITAQITRFLPLSLHHRPFFSIPISSIPLISSSNVKFILKASFNPLSTNPQNHHIITKKPSFETQIPFSSLIKTTCIAIVTASLFFSSFNKHSIAAPVTQPPTVEEEEEMVADEEKEKLLEQHLNSNPEDIDALRTLLEIKLEVQKLQEAISIVDRLIQIEPSEKQWRLLKAHFCSYSGDIELAKLGFEEILSDDPLFVEAYHGLAMTMAESKSGELETLLKRIENGMEQCKVEKRKEDLRDFRMLVAQVRFIQGNYVEALKVYQELVEEEPRDFRPYLYQGIIYTLLRQTSEAKNQFDKYRRLVPKDHPYARYFTRYFEDAFTKMIGSQIPSSKS